MINVLGSGGISGDSSIQAAADEAVRACANRLCYLVAAKDTFQDAAEQQQLLLFFGPLHEMLNHPLRRHVWTKLRLSLLLVSRVSLQPERAASTALSMPQISIFSALPTACTGYSFASFNLHALLVCANSAPPTLILHP